MSDYPFPNRISGTSGQRQVNPIGGNKVNPIDTPVKQTDISKAVGMLYQSIEALDNRMSVLSSRLSSVLVSKPKCAEEKKCNEISQCELAKSIRGAGLNIDKLTGIVNDILEDLEI
jgi:hypothetical protein